jgi:glycyl-tRNA synthetase
MSQITLSDIVSLAKRRGFVFPGSEIYGGLANTYDYGPLGIELLRNIKNLWWKHFVTDRPEIFGLDSCILMSPRIWEASGHTASFNEVLIDCKSCQYRTRADHLVEDHFENVNKEEIKVEGFSEKKLDKLINDNQIPCPNCSEFNWTPVRKFNALFQTHIGILPDKKSLAYLRGEIAQGMFVNFKQVLDTASPKLPFGLAQQGAAFRNEITLGNFIFRTLQFNLAEFEYFFDPENQNWEKLFESWQAQIYTYSTDLLGLDPKNLRWRAHTDDERSHYSTRTEDLDFRFPFGFKEMFAIAYRTDFDLRNHMEKSGADLRYTDPDNPDRKFIPHVVEPTFGMDRAFLSVICNGYVQEKIKDKTRTVLKLKPQLAPHQLAVFPLLANKPDLVNTARQVFDSLKTKFHVAWDDRGNIGKRYFSQDEIGTPWCVTIDFDTLKDQTVTIRDRDTTQQKRYKIDNLVQYFQKQL